MSVMARVEGLREKMAGLGLHGFLVSQPESRRYLSGFTGHDHPPSDSAGYLLLTPSQLLLFTDGRTVEQAEGEARDYQVVRIEQRLAPTLAPLLPDLKLDTLGFEGNHLPFRFHEEVKDVVGPLTTFAPTYDLVDGLRANKEPDELAAIQEAVELADRVYDYLLTILKVGVTEKEVAWKVEAFLRENGSEGIAFDPIVASGPNGSRPHHVPGERRLRAGDPVTVDWGARINGYCSDITRTFIMGKADEQFTKLYNLVLDGQKRAAARAKPGMTGEKADSLARSVIADGGYGAQFAHGTGHGVGLAIHERPRLGLKSSDLLEEGMVFSVEPGVYLPGWGGIRIEDLVTLRGGRPVILTRAPKELESMEVAG